MVEFSPTTKAWEPEKLRVLSSSQKAGRLQAQEEPVIQFESKGRKRTMSHLKGGHAEVPPYSQDISLLISLRTLLIGCGQPL